MRWGLARLGAGRNDGGDLVLGAKELMFESKDYVNFGIAVFGAGLGIWNAWHAWQDKRVRLRVIPQASWMAGRGMLSLSTADSLSRHMTARGLPNMTIEVVNLSSFPVVISEIGLRESDLLPRSPFYGSYCKKEHELPARLEARASATWTAPPNYSRYTFTDKTCVYAETACGNLVLRGGSFMIALNEASRRWRKQHEADAEEVLARLGE